MTRFLLGVTERPLCRALGHYQCDAREYPMGEKMGPVLSRFVVRLAGAQKAAEICPGRAARMFQIKDPRSAGHGSPAGRREGFTDPRREHPGATAMRLCPGPEGTPATARIGAASRVLRNHAGINSQRRRGADSQIGIGGRIAPPPLPHHRTYGSVYGGSIGYAFRPSTKDGSPNDVR